MTEENSPNQSGEADVTEAEKEAGKNPVPYEIVLQTVVKRIKNEPFLFIIAIVALLIGLAIQATNLASPDLRFVFMVIAILTFIAILGYYLLEGWKLFSLRQTRSTNESTETPPQPFHPRQHIRGEVKVEELSGDTRLGGVRANTEALHYQGNLEGRVDARRATGGSAYGVDLGEDSAAKPDQT
jgi:hypothetical protein